MIYIASYAAIGLLVFVIYRFAESRCPTLRDVSMKLLFDGVEEIAHSLAETVGDVVPLSMRCGFVVSRTLHPVFLILGWPVLAVNLGRYLIDEMRKGSDKPVEKLEDFEKRGTPWKVMSIREIEAHEMVDDPAGGAPKVPFGHLNPLWQALKSGFRPGDRIICYMCRPDGTISSDPWSRGVEGYLLARRDIVVAKIPARSC